MGITLFNRREVCITRDMTQRLRVEDMLRGAGIEYRVLTNSFAGSGRYHGVPGIDAGSAYEYRIYVHKNDYARVRGIC